MFVIHLYNRLQSSRSSVFNVAPPTYRRHINSLVPSSFTFAFSIFRNWDQFETNKALFGVETTFNEELYTTKLERGPQMREREREAWRIAREIEGQTTRNPHVAEVSTQLQALWFLRDLNFGLKINGRLYLNPYI